MYTLSFPITTGRRIACAWVTGQHLKSAPYMRIPEMKKTFATSISVVKSIESCDLAADYLGGDGCSDQNKRIKKYGRDFAFLLADTIKYDVVLLLNDHKSLKPRISSLSSR